ncbi:hypothetical protein HMPREF0379_0839 [[Eubacterium] yurii subsp. margaretiae ATCC 43715]|nr:hypothetical protein HMPREF0379_0839 [[Eubacterium] yurii subsp. margaretiae ATCC 43715]
MEDFIKKIFEIDDEAEKYEQSLEEKKKQLIQDRQDKLNKIDKDYEDAIKAEKENLNRRLSEIESSDNLKLDDFRKKAEDIRRMFEQKKEMLIEEFADSLL